MLEPRRTIEVRWLADLPLIRDNDENAVVSVVVFREDVWVEQADDLPKTAEPLVELEEGGCAFYEGAEPILVRLSVSRHEDESFEQVRPRGQVGDGIAGLEV